MSSDKNNPNAGFDVPTAPGPTAEQMEALRAQARAIVAAQFDEKAVLAQLVAEEQARRTQALTAQVADELDDLDRPDAQGFPKVYCKLNVAPGQGENELAYVPVGIGGHVWKIQRGVDVIVPEVAVQVLKHAVSEAGRPLPAGGVEYRLAPRFPYTVTGTATHEEYLAFVESCKAAGTSPVQRG